MNVERLEFVAIGVARQILDRAGQAHRVRPLRAGAPLGCRGAVIVYVTTLPLAEITRHRGAVVHRDVRRAERARVRRRTWRRRT